MEDFPSACFIVLNAFRHQRKEHNPVPLNGWPPSRAQRLSASTEGTLGRRHEQDRRFRVLNAFRHQRKEHGTIDVDPQPAIMCSTPFGINGRNTW